MSDSPAPSRPDLKPLTQPAQWSLLRIGGLLGLCGIIVEFLLFLAGCHGLLAAFTGFPVIPLLLGSAGILLALIGAVYRKPVDEDTHVLFGIFTNALCLIGAIVEIGVGKNWNLWH